MEVAPRTAELVRGRLCLIVDDVVTTGSTLAEAARAVRAAGATDVRAAVIAATRRRSGP
jgi:predicted amidophosphoribosyltransferase